MYIQCIALHRVPQIAILRCAVNIDKFCISDTDDDRGDCDDDDDGDDDSAVMMMLMMLMMVVIVMMVMIVVMMVMIMMMMVMMVMIVMRVTVEVEDFLWSPGTTTARSLIGRLEGRVDWWTIDKLAWLATSKKSFEFILHLPPILYSVIKIFVIFPSLFWAEKKTLGHGA